MLNASSYLFSLISLANLVDPVTFVLSPIFTKLVSGLYSKGSMPAKRNKGFLSGMLLGIIE